MKILVVSDRNDRSEFSLVTFLAKQGDEITLLCNPNDPQMSSYEKLGIHVIPQLALHRLDIKTAMLIRKLCLHKPIESLYCSFNAGISASLMATIGLPTRVVAYRGTLGNLSHWDPASYLTHYNPRLNGVIANCQAVGAFLEQQGIATEKIKIVLKGHDRNWYSQNTIPDKTSLQIDPKRLVVGMVANMRPLKGIECLLEAIQPLTKDFPIALVLIGEERGTNIREKVHELQLEKYVHFLGFRKDAAELSSHFDIAVMPSTRREGVARSVLEAMSHSKPCVVTNVGGLPEAVKDLETGIVVPPNDSQALSEALRTLLADENLRRQYGENARKHFDTTFALPRYHKAMRDFLLPQAA